MKDKRIINPNCRIVWQRERNENILFINLCCGHINIYFILLFKLHISSMHSIVYSICFTIKGKYKNKLWVYQLWGEHGKQRHSYISDDSRGSMLTFQKCL